MRNLLYVAPPETLPTAAEVVLALENARLTVKIGWTQNRALDVVDGVTCFCLVAAITAHSRTKAIRRAAIRACQMALPGRFHGYSLESFNDDRNTQVGDVCWLLISAKSFVGQAVAA